MANLKKQMQLNKFKEMIKSKDVVVLQMNKMNAEDNYLTRKKAREFNIKVFVIKNKLAKLVLPCKISGETLFCIGDSIKSLSLLNHIKKLSPLILMEFKNNYNPYDNIQTLKTLGSFGLKGLQQSLILSLQNIPETLIRVLKIHLEKIENSI